MSPWKDINRMPLCDDLVWFCRGKEFSGPRKPCGDEADYWDHWCYVEPPVPFPCDSGCQHIWLYPQAGDVRQCDKCGLIENVVAIKDEQIVYLQKQNSRYEETIDNLNKRVADLECELEAVLNEVSP